MVISFTWMYVQFLVIGIGCEINQKTLVYVCLRKPTAGKYSRDSNPTLFLNRVHMPLLF